MLVIGFEVSLINNKEFKYKMEVVMTLECVSNIEGRWHNIRHSREEYE